MFLITTQKQLTECKKSTAPEVARRRVEQIGQARQLRLHLGMLELEYASSFLSLKIDCPMPLHLCHSSASHNNSPGGFLHTYLEHHLCKGAKLNLEFELAQHLEFTVNLIRIHQRVCMCVESASLVRP